MKGKVQRPAPPSVPRRARGPEGRCTTRQGAFTFHGHRLASLYRPASVAR